MARGIHVCCGSNKRPHEPCTMRVDKNGVDIFRIHDQRHMYDYGDLVLTEGRGWEELALKMNASDWKEFQEILFKNGGDYYGSGDRVICPICGSVIVWRV